MWYRVCRMIKLQPAIHSDLYIQECRQPMDSNTVAAQFGNDKTERCELQIKKSTLGRSD